MLKSYIRENCGLFNVKTHLQTEALNMFVCTIVLLNDDNTGIFIDLKCRLELMNLIIAFSSTGFES